MLSADPSLGPGDVRTLLNDTACDLFTRGGDDRAGAGLVRAADALEAAVAGIGRGLCFLDVEPDNVFFGDISAFAQQGVTFGCNQVGNRYCPTRQLTRGEMAAFLARSVELPPASRDHFTDDEGSIFEDDINRIAEAGITDGCNPPVNNRFCPTDTVTRQQMAACDIRALD